HGDGGRKLRPRSPLHKPPRFRAVVHSRIERNRDASLVPAERELIERQTQAESASFNVRLFERPVFEEGGASSLFGHRAECGDFRWRKVTLSQSVAVV